MSYDNVIILAAGTGERWAKGGPTTLKQLADVGGETVIERQLRQLHARGIWDITIVAHDYRLKHEQVGWFVPEPRRYVVESWLSARELWRDGTLVLLGDVYFTDAAMDTMLAESGLKWFGREHPSKLTGGPGEVFAMGIGDPATHERVVTALRVGIEHADETGPHRDRSGAPKGSVWQPYRHLIKCPLDDHRVDEDIWVEIDDWTDDFDTPTRYAIWSENRERFGAC